MKLILTQPEIESILREHIQKNVTLAVGSDYTIDFVAGRGDNGITATIEIPYLGVAEIPEITASNTKAAEPEKAATPSKPAAASKATPAPASKPKPKADPEPETETPADEEAVSTPEVDTTDEPQDTPPAAATPARKSLFNS